MPLQIASTVKCAPLELRKHLRIIGDSYQM